MPAPVAQWIEQQPSKLLVVGSNPARGAEIQHNGEAGQVRAGGRHPFTMPGTDARRPDMLSVHQQKGAI